MKNYYYYSDCGCIKIGNKELNAMLLNGKGEGTFWIKLFKKNEKIEKTNCNFLCKISGNNLKVYIHDICFSPTVNIGNGEFLIFSKMGDILIEKQ